MSHTPRTDAAELLNCRHQFKDGSGFMEGPMVPSSFARTLESEVRIAETQCMDTENLLIKAEQSIADLLTAMEGAQLDHDSNCATQTRAWAGCDCGTDRHNKKIAEAIAKATA